MAHTKNQYFLAAWDIENDCAKRIDIPCKCSGRDACAFLRPMYFRGKIYLFPITADHFYEIDLKNESICISKELDQMLVDFPDGSDEFKVSGYEIIGDRVIFNTWWDYGWHIFDFKTKEWQNFEITLEDDGYWRRYHLKYGSEILEKQHFLHEHEFKYSIFLETIKESRRMRFSHMDQGEN